MEIRDSVIIFNIAIGIVCFSGAIYEFMNGKNIWAAVDILLSVINFILAYVNNKNR